MDEKNIGLWQRGKEANLLLGLLEPVLKEEEDDALIELRQLMRSGETQSAKYIGLSAKLCAYEDLRTKLAQRVLGGNKIAKEIVNGNG